MIDDHDRVGMPAAVTEAASGPRLGVHLVGVFVPWQAVVAVLAAVVVLTAMLVGGHQAEVRVRSASNSDASALPELAGADDTDRTGEVKHSGSDAEPADLGPAPDGDGLSGHPPTTGTTNPTTTTVTSVPGSDGSQGTTGPDYDPPASPRPETTTTTTGPTTTTTGPTTTTTRREPPSILGQIVFMSDRAVYGISHDYDIWVMDVDGSDARRLTDHFGSDSVPDLSPDGRRIVWLRYAGSGHHVMSMDADGTNVHELTDYPGEYQYPRWSPDGRRILYSAPGGRLYTMKADGTDARKVFENPTLPIRSASWAPDGARVVIDTNNSSAPARGLWVLDLSDGSANRIFADEAISPAWSPDGTRIAFNAGPGFSHIFTVAPDGGGAVQVTTGPGQDQGGPARFEPAWSPDGTRIVYLSSQPNYEIFSMAADGSDVRNLTVHPADDQQATF